MHTWRGYQYDLRGALTGVWEHQKRSDIDTSSLQEMNHSLGDSEVDNFGSEREPEGAEAWDYEREQVVGSLQSITSRSGNSPDRWTATKDRLPGYRLQEVEVDNTTYAVGHNDAGEVTAAMGTELVFGPLGRLTAVVDPNGDIIEAYSYDSSGRLSAIFDSDGVSKTFAYDGIHMISAFDGADRALWEAAWGVGVDDLLHWRDLESGASYLPITNHRKSVVAAWQVEDSEVSDLARYDAYGRRTNLEQDYVVDCREQGNPETVCTAGSQMPFGFATSMRSSRTGLIYLRNRWYSPRLAQFVSQDPLGYVDSYNPYAYVGHDPINFVDPFGLASEGDGEGGTPNGSENGSTEVEEEGWLPDWLTEMFEDEDSEGGSPTDASQIQTILKAIQFDFSIGRGGSPGGSIYGGNPDGLKEGGVYVDAFITALEAGLELIIPGHGTTKGAREGAESIVDRLKGWLKNKGKKGSKPDTDGGGAPNGEPGTGSSKKTPSEGEDARSRCTGTNCRNPKCFTAGTLVATTRGLEAIEEIQVGDRVDQFDGAQCSVQPFVEEPDNCAVVTFEFDSPYGYADTLVVELMRTRDWMTRNDVEIGAMVELEFSELKVKDAGRVTTVASCPPIEREDACLVTGTFRHLNRDVMEVTFRNSDLVIEPTWLHPLWSLDRDGWVRAGKLEPGERLKSEAGPLVVDEVRELPSSHVVYNLEVAGDHKYLVGADGLLSHNVNGCDADWEHIFRNHTPEGEAVQQAGDESRKDLFRGFSKEQIQEIVRSAWDNRRKAGSRQVTGTGDVTQRFVGTPDGYNTEIEIYYNHSKKRIDTAYPKGQDLVNPYGD